MGWTFTGDPYANVGDSALSFDSEEDAKSFAERHGWEYVVCSILFLFFFSLFKFIIGLRIKLYSRSIIPFLILALK